MRPYAASLTILTKPQFTYPQAQDLIKTFHKYLLSLYYEPGTVLSIANIMVSKMLSLTAKD